MPDLRAAYQNRRDLLLEACNVLRREVLASLEDVTGSACDFRVIELDDYLRLAKASEDAERDVWCDSTELIVGTVSARTPEDLELVRSLTTKLFTTHHDKVVTPDKAGSLTVCVIPPWAKPASWTESIALPTRLTIRFLMKTETAGKEETVTLSPIQPLTLALSGGGLRATLFQLGIFVFLAEQNRLKDVKEIVSVSGGSILAAHFVEHWRAATSGATGFRTVAANLLVVTRSNIRDRVVIPWLWSRLSPRSWLSPRRGRTGRLKDEYERIFGSITLGEMTGDGRPALAIVATDAIRQDRVAFTTSKILRWSIQADEVGRYATPSPILSKGVELSLAVAASSCFPPVFPRLHLTHKDLGITYSEFKEDLELNDGGVLTNLGIEVLVALQKMGWADKTLILIADSERPQAMKPGRSPLTDVDASAAALSKGARDLARREFGTRGLPISFSDRAENHDGLSHRTETVLAGYRTDLDSPTWQEIHALMIHGAMIARRATEEQLTPVNSASLKETIAAIIAEAGGPSDLPLPDEHLLIGCEIRPKKAVWLNGIAVAVVFVAVCLSLWFVICLGLARG
jgi:predicted acylesterase/phospholipase RssA